MNFRDDKRGLFTGFPLGTSFCFAFIFPEFGLWALLFWSSKVGGSRISSAGLSFMLHVEALLVLVQALVSFKDITWIALKSFTRFRRPSMFKGVLQDSKVWDLCRSATHDAHLSER